MKMLSKNMTGVLKNHRTMTYVLESDVTLVNYGVQVLNYTVKHVQTNMHDQNACLYMKI